MLVGLIIYGALSQTSGGYLYDRQLVNYLHTEGDDIRIFSLPWRNYTAHLLDNFRPALKQKLLETPFDVLLQDELNHPSLFWLNGRLRPKISYPIVSIVHHLRSSESHADWQLKLFRQVERKYLHSVDGFIFNSETTRQTVEAISAEKKPHVITYPAADHVQAHIDCETIRKRASQEGPLRLLFVGNVIPRKGLDHLLSALANLPLPLWRLDITGDLQSDKAYSNKLRETAKSQGIADNITWHGRLPDQALQKQMAGSHVLAVLSTYEGFGIVYLEGMQFGLPAIGGTSGAAHEIITEGKNGYLVQPADIRSLTRKIKKLCDDRQLLAEMGCAALQRAQSHPTWNDSMAKVRQFLQQRSRSQSKFFKG